LVSSVTGLPLPSLVGRLSAPRFGSFGQAREQKPLISGAASEGKIMLLRKVNGGSDLDGQVWPGEGRIKVVRLQPAAYDQDQFRDAWHRVGQSG
jgi:hypothetical protein